MLKKIFRRPDETGLSLVEVIVAATMMVLVLTASALALTSGFQTAAVSAKKNQASQFAQQVISIAKQAPFEMIGLSDTNGDQPPGVTMRRPDVCNEQAGRGIGNTSIPTSDPKDIIIPVGYPGLVYCQSYTLSGIKYVDANGATQSGISPGTYLVMTDITQVGRGDFDSTTDPNPNLPATDFVPRRVTVTVWWGDNNEEKVTASFVRTPNIAECIPTGIAQAGSDPIPRCNQGLV